MVERATVPVSPSFLPNWIARYLNDGIVIALLLRSPSPLSSPRERDTEVVKINLWRWQQQLSLRRHLHLHGLVGELVVNGDELVAYRK